MHTNPSFLSCANLQFHKYGFGVFHAATGWTKTESPLQWEKGFRPGHIFKRSNQYVTSKQLRSYLSLSVRISCTVAQHLHPLANALYTGAPWELNPQPWHCKCHTLPTNWATRHIGATPSFLAESEQIVISCDGLGQCLYMNLLPHTDLGTMIPTSVCW